MTETPAAGWDPPLAGTADEHLVASLERLRWTFAFKTDGLDDEQLRQRFPSSSLSLGSLLKHLAFVEADCFDWRIAGRAPHGWRPDAEADWHHTLTDSDTASALYGAWFEAVQRSRATLREVLDADGLDGPAAMTGQMGERVTVRRVLSDLVEEYGRHTGHADLLRELVDGRVGEDPYAGWEAASTGFRPLWLHQL